MSIESPTVSLTSRVWGEDKLSEYLERVRDHQISTFVNITTAFDMLRDVDDCYVQIAENIGKPKVNQLSLLFFYRSHAAYRAACGTSMAGQCAETFVLLRSCLEYSGYAVLIHKEPHLAMVWLRRHRDDNAFREMRRQFQAIKVETAIQSTDPGLGDFYNELYQRAIDFGGHPNAKGVTASMTHDEDSYLAIYLHGDDLALHHALDSTARTGLCSLCVFNYILSERFIALGLNKRLSELHARKHV